MVPDLKDHPVALDTALDSRTSDSALRTYDDDSLTQESFRSIMSVHEQAGPWEPADEIEARAIMGEVKLDFTRAVIPPSGMIDIYAVAIMGEIQITLPKGAEIELDATPILGSVECMDLQVQGREAGSILYTLS